MPNHKIVKRGSQTYIVSTSDKGIKTATPTFRLSQSDTCRFALRGGVCLMARESNGETVIEGVPQQGKLVISKRLRFAEMKPKDMSAILCQVNGHEPNAILRPAGLFVESHKGWNLVAQGQIHEFNHAAEKFLG